MSGLPDTVNRDGLENDFKPLELPPGLERFAGFVEAYNTQAKKLFGHKVLLLDALKPWRDGRENAWQAIIITAMSYRDGADDLPIAHDQYREAEKFLNYLSNAAEQMPLGEFPEYQLNDVIPLLDGLIAARPQPRHGLTKSPIPAAIIYQLAHLYQRSTGRKPGAGKGHFATNFVSVFWDALGKERKEDALKNDLQVARKARPEAFELEQEA